MVFLVWIEEYIKVHNIAKGVNLSGDLPGGKSKDQTSNPMP
jgi:hypothetical protein